MIASIKAETQNANWMDYLEDIQYTLNTTINHAINKTPYEVVFGKPPNKNNIFGYSGQVIDETDELHSPITTNSATVSESSSSENNDNFISTVSPTPTDLTISNQELNNDSSEPNNIINLINQNISPSSEIIKSSSEIIITPNSNHNSITITFYKSEVRY